MDREEVMVSIEASVDNRNLIKHMLATEAVMRALAARLGDDEEKWAFTGLLHDIDVELTEGDKSVHGKLGADLAAELGATDDMTMAIMAHNEKLGFPRNTKIEKALYCSDPVTGLITATALVRPDKKLANVEARSVRKRFKEKAFAAGASREQMASCSELGLELDDFLALSLEAMKSVARDLGL